MDQSVFDHTGGDDDASAPQPGAGTPSWMMIFADLLSLLLTFFVLIFSMNSVQVKDWEAVVNTLSDRLNPGRALIREEFYDGHEQAAVDVPPGASIEYLAVVIRQHTARSPVLADARVRQLDDRLAISIPSELLFGTHGTRIIDRNVRGALAELAGLLRRMENQVSVVGYTDPSPVDGTDYKTHWELSLRRSLAVARILEESGYPRTVPVYGHGGTRFGDLLADLPVALQSRLSRRVDIMVSEYERSQ